MTHKPEVRACLVVAGAVAAINLVAFVLLVIADGGLHNPSIVPFALIPTLLACGGVLLTRNSETGFVFATAFSVGVCALSALGIVEACGALLQWQFSEVGESAAWMWLFQIPLASLTFLVGFFSLLFRLRRVQPAS